MDSYVPYKIFRSKYRYRQTPVVHCNSPKYDESSSRANSSPKASSSASSSSSSTSGIPQERPSASCTSLASSSMSDRSSCSIRGHIKLSVSHARAGSNLTKQLGDLKLYNFVSSKYSYEVGGVPPPPLTNSVGDPDFIAGSGILSLPEPQRYPYTFFYKSVLANFVKPFSEKIKCVHLYLLQQRQEYFNPVQILNKIFSV